MTRLLRNKKAFTLMELLIVIAIIVVLVAIAIPVFGAQLEKAREATDLANIRGAYAEVCTNALTNDSADPITVDLKQTKAGWKTDTAEASLKSITQNHVEGEPGDGSGNTATVEWIEDGEYAQITFKGAGPKKYINGNSRKEIMLGVADALGDIFSELLEGPNAQNVLGWNQLTTAGRTDGIQYKEIAVSELMNPNREMYRDAANNSFKWKQYMEEKGIDDSVLSPQVLSSLGNNSYVFFDQNRQPCAVGYYKSGNSGAYRVTYLSGQDKGKTREFAAMTDRHLYVYNRDAAEQYGTIVND